MDMTFRQKIDDTEDVLVMVPQFIKDVDQLIFKTPKRVIANYLAWRVIVEVKSTLSTKFRNIFLTYSKKVYGVKTRPPRWKTCVGRAYGSFGAAVSALFVRKHFDKGSKRNIDTLVKYIKGQFLNILIDNDWMDALTKKHAIDKANEMAVKVAFPDELFDDDLLAEEYHKIKLDKDVGYFDTMLIVSRWSRDHHLSFFRKPIDKHESV